MCHHDGLGDEDGSGDIAGPLLVLARLRGMLYIEPSMAIG